MIWLRFMGGVSQWPRVAASCVEASALFRLGASEGEKSTLWKRIDVELLWKRGTDFQKLILTIKQYIVCKIRKPLFGENDVMVTIFNPQNVVWIFFKRSHKTRK